uniref:Slingshot protein phosphatase 2 n=1 Tax=Gopherus evgoodei TaxID=1825980 RepID=A0A8C4W616_9SAUR
MALVTVQRSPTPSATSSPCASEADSGEEECRSQPRSISESFLTVKGAALFLPRGNGSSTPRINNRRNKHAGDLQQHLQAMFILLRPEDNIRLVQSAQHLLGLTMPTCPEDCDSYPQVLMAVVVECNLAEQGKSAGECLVGVGCRSWVCES